MMAPAVIDVDTGPPRLAYSVRASIDAAGGPIAGSVPMPRRRYRREMKDKAPATRPGMGAVPSMGHDVPGLGPPRGGRLRDRDVRRVGRRSHRARTRRRRVERDLVGRRGRCRARSGVPVHDPDRRRRPVADRPVCAACHELDRERDRVRPGGLRLGRRRLCHADLGRPGDLRDARRLVRAVDRAPGHLRRRPPTAALSRAAGRLGDPGHAPIRVRR